MDGDGGGGGGSSRKERHAQSKHGYDGYLGKAREAEGSAERGHL